MSRMTVSVMMTFQPVFTRLVPNHCYLVFVFCLFSETRWIFFRSDNWSSLQDGDVVGSEEEEQEDPKDYVKGKKKKLF